MHSCIYEGRVEHGRDHPIAHRFRYPLFALYVDLDELDALTSPGGALVERRWSWASFRRSDHLGDPAQSLSTAVRELVELQTGRRPNGPIRLLTQLRYFGYYFSPLNLYYCFAGDRGEIEAIVAEVNNTPWREQHCYVLWEGNRLDGSQRLRFAHDKVFHVSPFMGMDSRYVWRLNPPGTRLYASISVERQGERSFKAAMNLQRRPLSRGQLRWRLVRFPWMTVQIILAIYFEALRLWLKKLPYFPHPLKTEPLDSAKA